MRQDDLRKVSLSALGSYLNANGWKEVERTELVGIWRRDGRDILVPASRDLLDYDETIELAIEKLAAHLDRKPALILQDLLLVAFDIIEFKNLTGADEHLELSALPLNAAPSAIESLQRLSLGAAYATSVGKRKGVVPSRRPTDVTDFLASLQFGPHTNGSKGWAVFAPIPLVTEPMLFDGAQHRGAGQITPFARRVTTLMPEYIKAAVNAALEARETDNLDPFEAAINDGVTTVLMRGLQQLTRLMPNDQSLLQFEYSPMLYVSQKALSVPQLSKIVLQIFDDAIDFLENKEPKDVDVITGPVVSLGRASDDTQGAIVVTSLANGKAQNVYIRLAATQYDIAISAHQQRAVIEVHGSLRRERRRLWLDEPEDLRIMQAVDDSGDQQLNISVDE